MDFNGPLFEILPGKEFRVPLGAQLIDSLSRSRHSVSCAGHGDDHVGGCVSLALGGLNFNTSGICVTSTLYHIKQLIIKCKRLNGFLHSGR